MRWVKRRIKLIPKGRNHWGGRVVERPGGMERDENRINTAAREVARQRGLTTPKRKRLVP
jgi:hypothetical protein